MTKFEGLDPPSPRNTAATESPLCSREYKGSPLGFDSPRLTVVFESRTRVRVHKKTDPTHRQNYMANAGGLENVIPDA
jgi:hypothetical protein